MRFTAMSSAAFLSSRPPCTKTNVPDLNQENPAVAQYLIQNTVWWIVQAGLDGLRIDTFPYVSREFWNIYHRQIHELYPRLTTVGEVYNGDATITSAFAGGVTRNGADTGLDTPFDFPTYFALRDVFLHNAAMTKLTDVLRLDALYPHPERLVPFLGNHDTERFMGEPGATMAKLKLAFTVLLTMRGMPQIYSGDELAMAGAMIRTTAATSQVDFQIVSRLTSRAPSTQIPGQPIKKRCIVGLPTCSLYGSSTHPC
jgi:glycosidase